MIQPKKDKKICNTNGHLAPF